MRILLLMLLSSFSYGAQLSPSLLMFHEWDLNACPQRLEKILDLQPKSIQILITGHHQADSHKNVIRYKYYVANGSFLKLTPNVIQRFTKKLKTCFAKVPAHINLAITLHINDSDKSAYWRNLIIFNPLEKKEGYSYYDFMIQPTINALSALKKTHVNLSLQGEMGATVFSYPENYLGIIKKLKQDHPGWTYGISFNHNKVNGGITLRKITAMKLLFKTIDFLGFSAYQPFKAQEIDNYFHRAGQNFLKHFKAHGITLPRQTPLHFREVALGGGNWQNTGGGDWRDDKSRPALTPQEAAKAPYSGVYGAAKNPWIEGPMRNFRIQYHETLINFLRQQNLNGPHPVTEAFLWNTGSWDPLDIYPGSHPFKDPIIQKLISNQ